jgi:hypothetical protein
VTGLRSPAVSAPVSANLSGASARIAPEPPFLRGPVPSNVSGYDQTVRSIPDMVCAVPLWMLQVPDAGTQPVHNARVFCLRANSKIKSQVKPRTAARRES